MTKLASAKNKHIYDLCLYTKEEFMPKAQLIASRVHPELANKLKILPWSSINEEKVASEMFKGRIRSKFVDGHI